MKTRIIRSPRDGLPDPLDRKIMPARLRSDDSQQVQRMRVPGLHGEDLPVKQLCFRQSASLVVLDGGIKCLGDGHGGESEVSFAHQDRHVWR